MSAGAAPLVSRPFLRRCWLRQQSCDCGCLPWGWTNQCRSALWGSLRHKLVGTVEDRSSPR